MSHERLTTLIQEHQDALAGAQDSASQTAHTTILGILRTLDRGEITHRQALRLLGQQALTATDEPTQAALYRQAAAGIRQMQREEQ